jgi:NAD(P)-dependent dehydrogenase (short-subunit alcohol dehydrogenase family)
MAERPSSSIVNIASTTAREPLALSAPYSAAKAALVNFSKVCADVFAPLGVRVNCVLPGIIETSATARNAQLSMHRTGKTEEEVMRAMLTKHSIPTGRIGRPEEVAALVHMLVSPSSAYVTGATVYVDGGAHRSA